MTLTAYFLYLFSFFMAPIEQDRTPPADAQDQRARSGGEEEEEPPLRRRGVLLDISNGF